MAEQNLSTAADFAKVSAIDFAARFGTSIDQLMALLGLTRKVEKQPGTVVKTYKVVGELADGKVGEGETIPLSEYSTEVDQIFEMELHKYRKATTLEAINDKGYEQAVDDTDAAMLKDVQNGIRSDFYGFLTGDRVPFAAKGGLQAALAALWTKNQILWEDTDASGFLYFVSPEDIGEYLEGAEVTTQTAFGMTYIQGFLGIYDVVSYSGVPKGKVFSTAKGNIILYYVNPKNGDLAKVFEFVTDATGLIGVHRDVEYSNLTTETVMLCGVKLFAENTDGIVCVTIDGNSAAAASLEGGVPVAFSLDTAGITEAVAAGVTEALASHETDKEPAAPASVNDKSTTSELEAYAEAHGISLDGCATNGARLEAIRAAEGAA